MDAARFRRAKDGTSKTLSKSEKRRKLAESGSPFLWILSFGEAKESSSPVGARTDIKINCRDSDTKDH
ncbi:MAG: hypothetical protein Q8S55_24375 [Methylococcaceae bacterium]|nr:hypothetical protein [Methylococcaceae bacterium]